MSPKKLFATLAALYPLSEDFKKSLLKELVFLTLPKNYMLLETPKISTHAFYLNEGFATSYSFVDGRKRTESFWQAGDIMASFESFIEQKASLESIQLMRKSEVFFISFDSVMKLCDQFPEAQRICRSLLVRQYAQYRDRTHNVQVKSIYEQFKELLKRYPGIEVVVSQDAIASYLGITNQSLARMKRKKG